MHRWLLTLSVTILALSLGSNARERPAAAAPPDGTFGVVQAIFDPEKALAMGARWERLIFPWELMQPSGPNEMRPGYFTDEQIAAEAARGLNLVGVVLYTPQWAAQNPGHKGAAVPRNLYLPFDHPDNYWGRFFSRLVERYRGRVDSWIVWNEPDLIDSPTFMGSEADYYQLLKVAYQAGKRANPSARIVFAGLSYWNEKENGRQPFLRRVLEVAGRDPTAPANGYYFDAVAVHPYSNPLNAYTLPMIVRRILKERGLDKPVWIDETNVVPWDDPGWLDTPTPFRATLDEQASYIVQALSLGLAAGVERVAVYKLRDEFPEFGQLWGLIREDGTPRPAYTAYQVIAGYLSGARSATFSWSGSSYPPTEAQISDLLASSAGRWQFVWPADVAQVVVDRGSQRVTIVWNTSPGPVTALVRAAGDRATLVDKYGRARPVASTGGYFELLLEASRHNTDPRDSNLYLTGGSPWILVEELGPDARPPAAPQVAPAPYFKETGYHVANAAFWDYFQKRGGVRVFGYPVSRQMDLLGYPTQFFQRHVMQLGPDGNVRLINLLDSDVMPFTRINGSVFPAVDEKVKAQTPAPSDPAYADKIVQFVRSQAPDDWQGKAVGFGRTFLGTVGCRNAFPEGECQETLLPLMDVELWGAPVSGPAVDPGNPGFVYQRFQRGIMHFDERCQCTQGLLLADYLKALMTGRGLPPDLEQQARGSRFYRQYDNRSEYGLARPQALPRTRVKDAFEPERP